jgi:nucleolar protein 9
MLESPSFTSMPMPMLLNFARHPVASRAIDVILEHPSVPSRARRTFVRHLIGHYHVLADDRIGSRVVDRCWDSADVYLKVGLFPSGCRAERTQAYTGFVTFV